MSIDGAVFLARRWPRAGIAALTCALLVALGLISCPAARAAHGPAQHHRPVGKVVVTAETPGPGASLWNHTPDQDVGRSDQAVGRGPGDFVASAHRDVAGRAVPSVHSRGPPG